MIVREYLEQHKAEHKLTWGEVIYLIDQEKKYYYRPIPTFVPCKESAWSNGEGAEIQRCIRAMYKEKVPYHFAYIKFYKTKEGYGPFALVAGKSNLGCERKPENPDFDFDLSMKKDDRPLEEILEDKNKRRDKAKQFLLHTESTWYCQDVLAIWTDGLLLTGQEDKDENGRKVEEEDSRHGSQARKAERDVEKPLQDLLGLFSS